MRQYAIILLLLPVLSCAPKEMDLEVRRSRPSGIIITPDEANIVEGRSMTLTAKTVPWNAESLQITWSTSDPDVVTVSSEGKISAISPGIAEITATAGACSAVCNITVKSSEIPAESVSIAGLSCLSVKVGKTAAIKADVLPEEATERVQWSSSDPDIFEVDASSGTLKALSPGLAYLTASVSSASSSIPVQVHGDLWIEQTDALVRPVAFEKFDFITDTIRVARGEVATFQGIVYSDVAQGVVRPDIVRFAMDGQDGIAVEPRIYWLKDIRCSEIWDSWAGGRAPDAYPSAQQMFPDPMIPADNENVTLNASGKRPLWVEFEIPDALPAGIYKGTVSVSGSASSAEQDFYVQVYDVSLPEKQTMDVIQWMTADNTSFMNNNEPTDMHSNYDTFFPEIVELMNGYGQNCWKQMYCGYNIKESFTVGAEYDADRGIYMMRYEFNDTYWKRDFDFFDKYCRNLSQIHGNNIIAARNVEDGTLTVTAYELAEDGGVAVDASGKPVHTYVTFPTADQKEIEKAKFFLRDYFSQLHEYLRSHKLEDGRTWLEVYVQTLSDEPNDKLAEAYNQISHIVRESAPEIKRLEPIETGLLDPYGLDYPCPTLSKINEYRATGSQIQCMYTCMQPQGNYANRFIRIPLFKTRLVHWVQYRYGASGYLHWGLNYWSGGKNGDPWTDAAGDYIGGDMWIIWPGYRTVYPSIRLSAMRDGIRDFELLKMVEEISPAKAEEFCSRVVYDNANYNLDVPDFRKVRKDILEFLDPAY